MKWISLLLVGLMFSCANFQRHENSGYYNARELRGLEVSGIYNSKAEKETSARTVAARELGISSTKGLTASQTAKVAQRATINKLEGNLRSNAERAQYYQTMHLFRDDRDRLAFLSLPSMAERERWVEANQLKKIANQLSEAEKLLVQDNDIAMGMSQKAVRESWGDPSRVETSGAEIYRNEKWTFNMEIPTPNGYVPQQRIVFFEAGRVVGWQSGN